jgi:hypothetical protein
VEDLGRSEDLRKNEEQEGKLGIGLFILDMPGEAPRFPIINGRSQADRLATAQRCASNQTG